MKWLRNLRWRYQVSCNRRRHPDLVEREKNGEDAIYIAQEMLVRDRIAARKKGIHPPNPDYPDLWDYHYPRSLGLWFQFKSSLSALFQR